MATDPDPRKPGTAIAARPERWVSDIDQEQCHHLSKCIKTNQYFDMTLYQFPDIGNGTYEPFVDLLNGG